MADHTAFAGQQDDRAPTAIANGVRFGIQPAFGSPDTTETIPFLSKLAVVRYAFRCAVSIMMRLDMGR